MELLVKECKEVKNGYLLKIEPEDSFYIDGKGGQLGDRGRIDDAQVLEVTEQGVLVDRAMECKSYSFEIDFNRREDIAQQHTAQHIFSAVAYNDFHLNTVGFRMAQEYTTVDLDSNEINEEIISKIEAKVNEIINRGIELKVFIMDNEEARKIEGLRKAIKEKVVGDVRFVEIPEIDLGACAGFHVKNTKDIKLFKIINHEKIKGNFTRFFFLAGDRALLDYDYKHRMSRELCHIFSCKDNEILDMLDKQLDEKKEIESELKNLSLNYAELLADKLLKESPYIKDFQPIIFSGEESVAQFLGRFMGDNNILITNKGENFAITAKKFDCKSFIKYLVEKYSDIKGGGSPSKGNFKGSLELESLKESLFNYLLDKSN